jgi:peptide/nickel transport system permease protein
MTVEATDAAVGVGTARPRRRRSWRAWPADLRVGVGIYAFAGLLAAVGAVALDDPNRQDLSRALAPPGSPRHLLGTDALGHDVLAWIASSIVTSLVVGIGVVAISTIVGIVVGLVAGYLGGLADAALMRLVDLQLAVPPLLLFIAASATVGNSMIALILLISVVSWVPYARVVRTQALTERTRASIAAARLAGATRRRILFVHLLPPALTLITVMCSLQLGYVLLWEAGLSFIGLGITPPTPSLGFLIAQGRSTLADAWWVVVCPGAVLVALLVAANLVGDGLQRLFGVQVEVIER